MKKTDTLTRNGLSLRHVTTTYGQTDPGSQQHHERVHTLEYSTRTVHQSPRKRACNPFASALADVFGIEEAHA